jgi:hypothetical protein
MVGQIQPSTSLTLLMNGLNVGYFLEDLANEWRNQYPVVEASACG